MLRDACAPLIGFASGGALWLNALAACREPGAPPAGRLMLGLVLSGVTAAAALVLLRATVRRLVLRWVPLAAEPSSPYARFECFGYAPFLLPLAGAVGVGPSIPLLYLVLVGFALSQLLLALRSVDHDKSSVQASFFASEAWLALLFLLSGMAALIYQVVWQRVLFAAYGVNIESVTLIVAVFMLGLGVGALGGGAISKRFPGRLPEAFAACECLIGLFGLFSIALIDAVAARTLHASLVEIGAVVFALLLLPTACMGATLPLLVSHLTRFDENVGASMGRLYAMNTLGAALASLFTVDVLFVLMGRQSAVLCAALLNLAVAFLVFRHATRLRRHAEPAEHPAEAPRHSGPALPHGVALALAAVVGLISLSQEILWVRVIAFAMGSAPQVFGHVLGLFLIGLAAGAWQAKRLCERGVENPWLELGQRFLLAALLHFGAIPLVASATAASKGLGLLVAYLAVPLLAYVLGAVLPLLVHVGVPAGAAVGPGVARIYLSNVLGSTAGPLLTGFVLLDRFSMEDVVLGTTLVSAVTALGLLALAQRDKRRAHLTAAAVITLPGALWVHAPLYEAMFDRLLGYAGRDDGVRLKYAVQNRSGVVAVLPDPRGDILYGGGAQDGRFNLDPVTDANMIRRAYAVAALHREPRRVLEIGLATGSWAWVVAAHRAVEHLTIVEINPSYVEIIAQYPDHCSLLHDPKVTIHHDDGRRWLRRHPERKFDVIVMNTTYHWRSNVTNLLSQEFLQLAKSHLLPRGVLYYNTTDSPDVVHTAATVFSHVTMYRNFVAASDHPFDMSEAEKLANLRRFERHGAPLLDPRQPGIPDALRDLLRVGTQDLGNRYSALPGVSVITDDNMLTEFKSIHSKDAIGQLYRVYDPERAWAKRW